MVYGFDGEPVQSVQIYQTEKHFHENEHDGRYTCDEIQYQNIDNQGERDCSQKIYKEKTENLIYEHDMDVKMGNKDTQKYGENYNQECDQTSTQKEIYFEGQE